MTRKRKKKNMYDDASMFDIHAFVQSGGVNTRVNASVPVVAEAPVETDLEIIAEEIKEWFSDDNRPASEFTFEMVFVLNVIYSTHESKYKQHEAELREFHRKYKITDFLWKRRKKDAKI